jgi:hypothetical protein
MWAMIPLIAACHTAGNVTSKPVPEYLSEELVVRRDAWLDLTQVPEPLRADQMPLTGGYYVLFSASGRYCAVDAAQWSAGANEGQSFACRWRWPRGVALGNR